MKRCIIALLTCGVAACGHGEQTNMINLPAIDAAQAGPLVHAMAARRSVRSFAPKALDHATLGALLWAAQGVSSPRGYRTAPSAGALYPLETYVASADGLYQYVPAGHTLAVRCTNDVRAALTRAAYGQGCMAQAPVIFIFTAVYQRETVKYGERGIMYTHMEAGHAAQNLMLRAVELGMGTVAVGAFQDSAVSAALKLPHGETPVYMIPAGYPAN